MSEFTPRGGVRTSRSKGLQAFTLAEVLITLGIIGVVASLTLPTLISNYQKKVYVTQLKKSYSVLYNGFKLMMGQDGVTELSDTDAFSGIGTGSCFSDNILTEGCRSMKEGLERVFSGIQFAPCDGIQMKYLNGSDAATRSSTNTCIMFPDGLELFQYRIYGSFIDGISFDVNGPKNPNTWGRDIFMLYINKNGVLMAPYSYADAESRSNGRPDRLNYYYWRTASSDYYKCDTGGRGNACAARVLEEDGMNY